MDARDCESVVPERHIAIADQVCQTLRCGGAWVHVDSLLARALRNLARNLRPLVRGLCLSHACTV